MEIYIVLLFHNLSLGKKLIIPNYLIGFIANFCSWCFSSNCRLKDLTERIQVIVTKATIGRRIWVTEKMEPVPIKSIRAT